MKVVRR